MRSIGRREVLGLLFARGKPSHIRETLEAPPPTATPSSRRGPRAFRSEVLVVGAFGALVVAAFAGCGARHTTGRTIAPPTSGAATGAGAGPTAGGDTGAGAGADATPRIVPQGGEPIHMTLYHLAAEPCPDAHEVAMPKCGGGSIATVSVSFEKSAAMQGTSRLCDGRVVGVQKTKPLCFVVVAPDFPWGMTSSGRAAVPFRSIAIDPSKFVMGRWYYVKELDGVVLPAPNQGARHDGCVRADDTGGAVKGNDVDLFVGPREAMTTLVPLTDRALTMAPGDGVCSGKESF